jgi:phosphopantetheinyl transferase (holo-ACP synthase)
MLLMLAGCASLSTTARMERYGRLTRAYEQAMTWSNFEAAYSATKARQESSLPDAARYADIRITSYEPDAPQVTQEGKIVKRVARIHYVHLSRMTELSLVTQEEWRYSDESGHWFLYSGFPQFK